MCKMPETEALVINTGPLLALISGYGDLSLLENIYKRVLVPFEVVLKSKPAVILLLGSRNSRRQAFLKHRRSRFPLSAI